MALLPAMLVMDLAMTAELGLQTQIGVAVGFFVYLHWLPPFLALAAAVGMFAADTKDQPELVGRAFNRALIVGALLSALLVYPLHLGAPRISTILLGSTAEAQAMSDYLQLRVLGLAMSSLLVLLAMIQHRLGRDLLVFISLGVMAVGHAALDYGFIAAQWRLPYLGLRGTAAAPIVAATVAVIWLAVVTLVESDTRTKFKLSAPGPSPQDRAVLVALGKYAARPLIEALLLYLLPLLVLLLHLRAGGPSVVAGAAAVALFCALRTWMWALTGRSLVMRGLGLVLGVAAVLLLGWGGQHLALSPVVGDMLWGLGPLVLLAAVAEVFLLRETDQRGLLFALDLLLSLPLALILRGPFGVEGIWIALIAVRVVGLAALWLGTQGRSRASRNA